MKENAVMLFVATVVAIDAGSRGPYKESV